MRSRARLDISKKRNLFSLSVIAQTLAYVTIPSTPFQLNLDQSEEGQPTVSEKEVLELRGAD